MAGILKENESIKEFWLEPYSKHIEPKMICSTGISGKPAEWVPYRNEENFELKASPTNYRCVLLDFGKEVGGFPKLVFGKGSLRRIGVQAVESVEHILNPILAESFSRADPALCVEGLSVKAGKRVDLPHFGGFRYLWLYPEHPGRIALDKAWVEYTPHISDPDSCGYFLCSDEKLNRCWFVGFHTLEMCTVKPELGGPEGNKRIGEGEWVLIDGAKRDRLIWTADLGPAGSGIYVSNFNTDSIRDSLISLVLHQGRTGYIPACSPTTLTGKLNSSFFGDYVAWWIVCLYQYYMHTGDKETVMEYFPSVKRALSYMHSQCRGGLFRQTPLNMLEWCFSVVRLGKPSYTNVMYYWALNCAAHLAHEIGEEEISTGFVSRAYRLGEAIERELLNAEKGVYVDTTVDKNRVPQDANSLAIVSGMVTEPQTQIRILEYLKEKTWVEWGATNVDIPYYRLTPGLQPHNKRVIPFMNYYEAQARFIAGDHEGAMELMKRCWVKMVESEPKTTFWEWKGKEGGIDNHLSSLCHAWSAGIVSLLTKHVLGIRPASAGYKRFFFDPSPCGLKWIEGRIPVPGGGFIEARIERKRSGYEKKFSAPRGIKLEEGRLLVHA